MIDAYVMIDGMAVLILTGNNLTHDTQEDPSKNYPIIPPTTPGPGTDTPTGLEGLVPVHHRGDGTLQIRTGRGRPRNSHRTFRTTDRYYDLKFNKGRRYRVTFTSMSDTTVAFERDFVATSLRRLLSEVAYFIGQTRKPRSARHFSVTFQAYPENVKIIDANVGVPFGEPQEADDRPLTILPSFDEDLAL